MNNSEETKKTIEIGSILKGSFLLYKNNFLLFISIAFIGYIVSIVKAFIFFDFLFLFTVLGIILFFWSNLALITALSFRYNKEKINFKDCFLKRREYFWRFIKTYILYGISVIGGLILLIIPGLYMGAVFFVSPAASVLEDRKNVSPFRFSKKVVKGNFWTVLALLLIIAVVPMAIMYLFFLLFPSAHLNVEPVYNRRIYVIALNILNIIYMPFASGIGVMVYHKLKERKKQELYSEDIEIPRKSGMSCCLGALLVLVIIVLVLGYGAYKINQIVGIKKIKKNLTRENINQAKDTVKGISEIMSRFGPEVSDEKIKKDKQIDLTKNYKYIEDFFNAYSEDSRTWMISLDELDVSESDMVLKNPRVKKRIARKVIKENGLKSSDCKIGSIKELKSNKNMYQAVFYIYEIKNGKKINKWKQTCFYFPKKKPKKTVWVYSEGDYEEYEASDVGKSKLRKSIERFINLFKSFLGEEE
ncbi:MAG: hypothetical protein ACOC56_01555 [Atribacterota bacterium]